MKTPQQKKEKIKLPKNFGKLKTKMKLRYFTVFADDLIKVECGHCAGFGHWYELPPNKGKKGGKK